MVIRQWGGALGRRNALAAMVGTVALVACNGDGGDEAMEGECVEVPATVTTATVALTSGASFTFEMNRAVAPNSVQNFVDKARCGALTGTIFHRVEDWVIQGGDPVTKGERGKDYYILGADQPEGDLRPPVAVAGRCRRRQAISRSRPARSALRAAPIRPSRTTVSSSCSPRRLAISTAATPISARSLRGWRSCALSKSAIRSLA